MQLDQDIKRAFEEENWNEVVEIVDRYVAGGWGRSSDGFRGHDTVYQAQLKGEAHFRMGEFDKVTSFGEKIVGEFRDTRDLFILYRSACVLLLKVRAHFRQNGFRETISTARYIDEWFERYKGHDFDPIVAESLVLQAKAETESGRFGQAVLLYDSAVERFGDSENDEVQRVIVEAFDRKANCLRMIGNDHDMALATYDEAIERYGGSEIAEIKSLIVSVSMSRAFTQAELGDFNGEVASYQEVIDRIGTGDTPGMHWSLALALGYKAMRQAETGRSQAALDTVDELEQVLDRLTGEWIGPFEWQPLYVRAMVLASRNERSAAVEVFRSSGELDQHENEYLMRGMIRFALNLIALGVSDNEVLDILSNHRWNSRALLPLIVALRQCTGESVRAPAEVLGVAEDIRKRIVEKAEQGILTTF